MSGDEPMENVESLDRESAIKAVRILRDAVERFKADQRRVREEYLALREVADRHLMNHREATNLSTLYLNTLSRITTVLDAHEKLTPDQTKPGHLAAAIRAELGDRFQSRIGRRARSHEEMLAHVEELGSDEPEAPSEDG